MSLLAKVTTARIKQDLFERFGIVATDLQADALFVFGSMVLFVTWVLIGRRKDPRAYKPAEICRTEADHTAEVRVHTAEFRHDTVTYCHDTLHKK